METHWSTMKKIKLMNMHWCSLQTDCTIKFFILNLYENTPFHNSNGMGPQIWATVSPHCLISTGKMGLMQHSFVPCPKNNVTLSDLHSWMTWQQPQCHWGYIQCSKCLHKNATIPPCGTAYCGWQVVSQYLSNSSSTRLTLGVTTTYGTTSTRVNPLVPYLQWQGQPCHTTFASSLRGTPNTRHEVGSGCQ